MNNSFLNIRFRGILNVMENLLCKGVTMNLPKEFEEKMKTLLGSEYEEYTACYDEPRHYGLRVNTAKISVEDFLKIAPGRWSRFRGSRMDLL
mgnify:CR=1 FL=1